MPLNPLNRIRAPISAMTGRRSGNVGTSARRHSLVSQREEYRPASVNLTSREMDTLQWMAEGKSDWEIGVILKVSEHFVDKIARQLRAKLNATNRAQTVAIALRQNLIR